MSEIRPQDVPKLRTGTLASVRRVGPAVIQSKIENNDPIFSFRPIPKDWSIPHVSRILAENHAASLEQAELFYVSQEMVELAQVAEASLPSFRLLPEDVPAQHGFIVFATPLGEYRNNYPTLSDEIDVKIVAASWQVLFANGSLHISPDGKLTKGSVHITWWEGIDPFIDAAARRGDWTPEQMAAQRQRTPINWGSEARLPFTTTEADDIPYWDPDTNSHISYQEARKIGPMPSWAGMQELTEIEDAHYDRAARRRAAREGRELPPVRVITLRRTRHSQHSQHEGEHGSREYHHRWLVRGHWRQQWFPKRQAHRPVWIAPHIKGPDDAPLLGGEKVYALRK